MILKGKLLQLGEVNLNMHKFSEDCKIEIPDILPVMYEFDNNMPIGTATVEKIGDILETTINCGDSHGISPIDEYIEYHGYVGVGGYYNKVKAHLEGGIKVVDECHLQSVSVVLSPVSHDYIVKKV